MFSFDLNNNSALPNRLCKLYENTNLAIEYTSPVPVYLFHITKSLCCKKHKQKTITLLNKRYFVAEGDYQLESSAEK